MNDIPTQPDVQVPTDKLLDEAKQVRHRYTTQQKALTALNLRIPILQAFLESERKRYKDSGENIERLELEISAAITHAAQLNVWLAKHDDTPENATKAEELARKILRIQKEIRIKQLELEETELAIARKAAGIEG